ncbi:MAG: chorismate synthase [Bacteriovoracaceae bacterium]|nr:chorismate synthase [Bacteriovoracaceae bacterium]
MRGNSFGKMLSITSFGESHGPAMGVVIDGVPAGLKFCEKELVKQLQKRAPGFVAGVTSRKEPDSPKILSGIFENLTLGTPIAVIIENTNQLSGDYEKLKDSYRPGHADLTTIQKYGIRDHRGGGRSSGRETVARVIGGYFASLIMPTLKVRAFTSTIGKFKSTQELPANFFEMDLGPYSYLENNKWDEIKQYLLDLKKNGESVGGRVGIVIDNCPAGLGEPAFDKLKADLAKAFMSIGGCTAFSYGLGEKFADLTGSEVSSSVDSFGGIEGGISNSLRITMSITFKPTSTIGEKAKQGRHDPCIVPRAIPVVEAMAQLVLADHYLRQNAYNQRG